MREFDQPHAVEWRACGLVPPLSTRVLPTATNAGKVTKPGLGQGALASATSRRADEARNLAGRLRQQN